MKKIKLSEICKVTSSKRIFEKEYVATGIPFIRGQEISNDSISFDDNFDCYISYERYTELANKYGIPQKNDILITAVGTIGNLYIVQDNRKFYFKDGNIIWIRNVDNSVSPKFLKYFMQSPVFKKQIQHALIGAVQKALTIEMLSKIEIELPPLSEQKKIGAFLYSLDEKISLNKKINATLEAMAKTLYDYWFVQFDFPDENGKPYKSSGGKTIFNAELGREIPEGWQVGKLSEFGNLKNGINYDKNTIGDALIKIVNVKDISASSLAIAIESLENIKLPSKQIKKYLTSDEDILIARSGIPGAVRILAGKNVPVIYCGFIICLKLFDKSYKNYLIFNLQKNYEIILTQSAGTIMQNVTQETLKKLQLAMPPATILKNFNLIINQIISEMQKNLLENFKLSELRDFLLPLLMNGQVGFKE